MFKNDAIALPLLDDKAVNYNIEKNSLKTSLIVLPCSAACTSHEFTTLRNCWTFGTAFNGVQLLDRN